MGSFDTTDLLARAIPLDLTLGGFSTAGDRVETPAVQAAGYLSDRGDSDAEADVVDGFFGLDDLLGSVLVDVLEGGVPDRPWGRRITLGNFQWALHGCLGIFFVLD